MSLYTKYRPKDWDSVISQDYITTILRNSLKSGRVSHAYLFHGSRGTGKTTSARILAKALNCLDLRDGNPCHECANCVAFDNESMLDVIEIDGASNNGVENVRELIERARFEPNQGTYKIYIIDEVHMLSTGAFNALLKILEEPPKHVKFVLATTEIDKVPETIRSRTLRFDFRKILLEDIISRLQYVAQTEGITVDPDALLIVAKSARGGLRDALTLLEQNIIDMEVRIEHVRHTLSLVEESMIDACIESMKNGNIEEILSHIALLRERHIQVRSFFDQIMYRLRDQMIAHLSDADFQIYSDIMLQIESAYGKIRTLPDGMMLIELTLLRVAKRSPTNIKEMELKIAPPKITQPAPVSSVTPPAPIIVPTEAKKETGVPTVETPEISLQKHIPSVGSIESGNTNPGTPAFSYPVLIAELKSTHPALTTDLKTARFQLEGNTLKLIFPKKWNYDRVNTPQVRSTICETLGKLYSGVWETTCALSDANSLIHEVDDVF